MTRTTMATANTDYQPTAKELITQFVEFSTECDATAQAKEEALNSLIDHLKELNTPTIEANEVVENCDVTPLSTADKKYIDVLSEPVYKYKVRDELGCGNLPLNALFNVVGDLKYLFKELRCMIPTRSQHLENIQVVFANYMANGSLDNETKTHKLSTQLWIIELITQLDSNRSIIVDGYNLINDLSDKIDTYIEELENVPSL